MTARGDVTTRDPGKQMPPARRVPSRPSRRRFWLRRAGVLLVIFLAWLTWSIGGALTAPGADTTSARLAEWGRFHGLGWVVTNLEQLQYKANPPKVGGTVAGGIPSIAPIRPSSSPAPRSVGGVWARILSAAAITRAPVPATTASIPCSVVAAWEAQPAT